MKKGEQKECIEMSIKARIANQFANGKVQIKTPQRQQTSM